jgi:hypothetical protein
VEEEVAEEVVEKEVVEGVAEEVVQEAEEENKQTLQQHPTSDSVETLQKYSWEIERKQTASSPNSSNTI